VVLVSQIRLANGKTTALTSAAQLLPFAYHKWNMHRMLDYEALSPKTLKRCLRDVFLQLFMLLEHVPSHDRKWGGNFAAAF
jgi:hypothetical protein